MEACRCVEFTSVELAALVEIVAEGARGAAAVERRELPPEIGET
jgi:hypothetical protein